jgi:UDP:flavonoid glycosyltransferase YjiC (YdhE family)
MPCAWDQPDNAERAARLGIARTISRRRYTPARVAAELRRLLNDPRYTQRASMVGVLVVQLAWFDGWACFSSTTGDAR